MVFTLQARWILLFSFVGTTFLIKSSLSRIIHSIWLKTKFEVLDIPAKILAFRSCHTWYTVAAKLSLREKLTKLLPCQEMVAHRIIYTLLFIIYTINLSVVRPRSCRGGKYWRRYYFDTPALERRHQSFGRVKLLTPLPGR